MSKDSEDATITVSKDAAGAINNIRELLQREGLFPCWRHDMAKQVVLFVRAPQATERVRNALMLHPGLQKIGKSVRVNTTAATTRLVKSYFSHRTQNLHEGR